MSQWWKDGNDPRDSTPRDWNHRSAMTREPDIVERLRKLRGDYARAMVIQEAADEIERLKAQAMTRELTEEELSHARTVKDNWQADAALRAEIERHMREKVALAGLVAKERAEVERLRTALQRIDGINDYSANYSPMIDEVLRAALEPKP